jgi:hypothetical protein
MRPVLRSEFCLKWLNLLGIITPAAAKRDCGRDPNFRSPPVPIPSKAGASRHCASSVARAVRIFDCSDCIIILADDRCESTGLRSSAKRWCELKRLLEVATNLQKKSGAWACGHVMWVILAEEPSSWLHSLTASHSYSGRRLKNNTTPRDEDHIAPAYPCTQLIILVFAAATRSSYELSNRTWHLRTIHHLPGLLHRHTAPFNDSAFPTNWQGNMFELIIDKSLLPFLFQGPITQSRLLIPQPKSRLIRRWAMKTRDHCLLSLPFRCVRTWVCWRRFSNDYQWISYPERL